MFNTNGSYFVEFVNPEFCIIYSISYESPLDYLKSIENTLSALKFSGHVIFDLLLCNGDSANRFFETWYLKNDSKFQEVLLLFPSNSILRERSAKFYASRIDILRNSILSEDAIELILKEAEF